MNMPTFEETYFSLSLKEILDAKAIQSLIDDFYALTHIGIAIVDMDGNVLVRAGWQDICTQFHRVHPETECNCRESDLNLSKGVSQGEFKLYRCKNNMWDIATPLIIAGQHLGNLFLGQFFFEDEEVDVDLFRQQAIRYGFDEVAYLSALEKVPRWSRETVNTVMSFYLKLASLISRLSYANLNLNQIIQAIPDPLTIIKADTGICLEVNDQFVIQTGYNRESVIGKTAGDINIWGNPADREKLMEGIRKQGFVEDLEAEFRQQNGNLFVGLMSARMVTINDETCIITVTKEITQRKTIEIQLAENEAKYRYLYDNSLVAMFTNTLEGKPVNVNSVTLQMLGYTSREEFLGRFSATEHWVDRAQRDKLIAEVRQKGVVQGFQALAKRTDGSVFWAEFSVRLNKDNQTLEVFAVDITKMKTVERELIEAKEKAEESDRLKSAFLANMSHEIRTPMNGILGFTELLKEPDLTGEEQQQYVSVIQRSGNRLLDTVNDLMDISRIETGQMPVVITGVQLRELMEHLLEFFTPQAVQKGLQFSFAGMLPDRASCIRTDRSKMESILSNLIKNALKYTDRGTIQFGIEQRAEEWYFFVSDTGIGVPENRREAIFNRFEQADVSDTRAYQGCGLGLSIAKAYVEMLGGRLGMNSDEGKGSTFWFVLPAGPVQGDIPESVSATTAVPPDQKKPSITKRLSILIVEDDESSSEYLGIILQERCSDMSVLTSGTKAISFVRDHPELHVILLDIKIPGIDGYEVARRIRKFNKEVVIIAQTAYALTGDKEKALAAGCNGYISKPIGKEKLMHLIDTFMG